ncbi:MAG: phosphonopyruvate decarboxylase [Spirochaetaceae bacterium]|jgi:phosphonopyruvate decarboxylase|nr:phosphonopyruvate decarboxylase [Spirochaetaceae bacterium]
MIETSFFYDELLKQNTDFFAGVPDSLLKSFCAYIADNAADKKYIITVNEGSAIALASGYHLATGKIPLVFMQNSGLGNAVNPLLSLADGDVYRIPLVLVIGWRGEPGVHDEPQHIKQGRVTRELLDAMEIPYVILAKDEEGAKKQIAECYAHIARTGAVFAFLVQKDTFSPYKMKKRQDDEALMSREEAIETIVNAQAENRNGKAGIIVSTTGMASRELYELREKYGMGHERDFLTVGSMGHASQIALGIALQKPQLPVTILDGDGAVLMHLGGMATLGAEKPDNIRHIVLNNGAHDSVGGQPTIADAGPIDLCGIARSCGYEQVFCVRTKDELKRVLNDGKNGLTFIEIKVKKGVRNDLGRPQSTPEENKAALMRYMRQF